MLCSKKGKNKISDFNNIQKRIELYVLVKVKRGFLHGIVEGCTEVFSNKRI